MLSLALFHQDIDSFIQTVREDIPFTGNPLGLPDSVATAACPGGVDTPRCNPGLNWQFNLPRNTPGGPVSGYEVNLQLPFFWPDGFWSNFGVLANYTNVKSDMDYVNGAGAGDPQRAADRACPRNPTTRPSTTRTTASCARVCRPPIAATIPTTLPGPQRQRHGRAPRRRSTSTLRRASNINDNFALTFEGVNLTDEANDQYLSPDNRSSFYHVYGRSLFFGARYTY